MEYVTEETNLSTRDLLLHKAEDLIMSTGAIMPIYYYTEAYLKQPYVKGFYSNPLGCWFFKQATIED